MTNIKRVTFFLRHSVHSFHGLFATWLIRIGDCCEM